MPRQSKVTRSALRRSGDDGGSSGGGSDCCADWPIAGVRYFAVDPIAGLDSNDGFSDVSLAAAGAVAKKTWAGLIDIVPSVGAGRIAVIGVKNGIYAEAMTGQFYGYRRLVIRSTLDFSNSAADKIQCAYTTATGTNVAGYNIVLATRTITAVTNATPIQVTTSAAHGLATGDVVLIVGVTGITSANGDYHVDVVDGTNFTLRNTRAPGQTYVAAGTVKIYRVQLAGGGAPALTAEPALMGKRWRYGAATTTAGLRNLAGTIIRNGTDTIVFARDVGVDPAAADVIFVETPTASFASANLWSDALVTSVVGFEYTTSNVSLGGPSARQNGAFGYPNSELKISFIDVPNYTGNQQVSICGGNIATADDLYKDETAAFVQAGTGIRCPSVSFYGWYFATIRLSCVFSTAAGNFSVFTACDNVVAAAAAFYRSIDFVACRINQNNVSSANVGFGIALGNSGSTTRRRLRMTGVSAHGGALNIIGSDAKIYGVFVESMDFNANASSGGLQVNGVGEVIQVSDLIGLGSSAGPGMTFVDSYYAQVFLARNAPNTIGGSSGIEVRLAGAVSVSYTDLNIAGITDELGNVIQGTGGVAVASGIKVNNQSGGALALGDVVRSNGTSGQVTKAQADTAAHAEGPLLTMVTSPASTADGYAVRLGQGEWVNFDVAPAAGALAYLDDGTAGVATSTVPPAAATNQKRRLGHALTVSGTRARLVGGPELLPVLSDGLAP